MTITGDVKRQLSYETFFNLPEKIKDSLLALYNLPELDFYDTYYALKADNYSDYVIREKLGDENLYDIEALKVSAEITSALYLIFSADHQTDYNRDKNNYNNLVEEANTRYGEILIPAEEAEQTKGWGYIGHRKTPYSIITTTRTTPGQEQTTTVDNVAKKIHDEDNQVRSDYDTEIIY